MKKIVFLQNSGKSYGGVAQVNKLLAEEFIEHGYDALIVSMRNNKTNIELKYNKKVKLITINELDEWGTYIGSDIKSALKEIKIFKVVEMLSQRLLYDIKMKSDVKKLKKLLFHENPDYIIVSYYQLLDMIPKAMYDRVINVHHSSFENAISHKATRKTLLKYKNKVKFIWLTKKTMENAIEYGFKNSGYIYNAVRFTSNKTSNVIINKKLIAITRLSEEKNIDIMIKMVQSIFKNSQFDDWNLEIYGDGSQEYEDKLKKIIKNDERIKLCGLTEDSKKELLNASINLNTSSFEGFSLTILEATECGVPTISFNFGESAPEEIINNETGYIVNSQEEYIEKLKDMMLNEEKLAYLSKKCKDFAKKFKKDKIVSDWILTFNSIDKLRKIKK